MPFDLSCIVQFTIPGDNTNIYCMVDEAVVAEAKAGLTVPQQGVVESRRYVPTQAQIDAGVIPSWSGNDPQPVYFRATLNNMKQALAKRWTD